MSPIAGEGGKGVAGSQPMSTSVHRAQINYGDLTPYLTYAVIGAVFITHKMISTNACELDKYFLQRYSMIGFRRRINGYVVIKYLKIGLS